MKPKPDTGQYVAAVEQGRTHDKVAVFDPATVPVHTDAEASGQATPRDESVAATRQQERMVPDHPGAGGGAWLLAATFAALTLIGLGAAVLTFPQL
jgi:hypothetical protein